MQLLLICTALRAHAVVVDLYSAKSTCSSCSVAIDINIIIKAAVDDDDDCFYIALFSALEQTHCARM